MLGYNTFYFKLVALIISSITAAFAGTLHTPYQPLVSPNVAGLGYTVTALLIILIGGVGTLSGALVGAAVFRLLDFGLRRYIGESASFHQRRDLCADCTFPALWHCRNLEIEICQHPARVGTVAWNVQRTVH